MAIDTLFLCFLEDSERNDGSPERPYFMSKQLMKILGVQNLLRKWRENTERKSLSIIHIWEYMLNKQLNKLPIDKHVILEQVAVAALDLSRPEIAEKCIRMLSADFPNSSRVCRLKAMYEESTDCFDQAYQLLDLFMKREETNALIRKRKIALLKSSGTNVDAISEACRYLPKFVSDQDAWHELSNFYLEEGDFTKAVFCMEELLLHNPQSYLIHLRLGDIYYTMGGVDNIGVARSYYFYSVKLNPKNIRALYGLYMCCGFIINTKSSTGKRKDAQVLGEWVLDKIFEISCLPVFNDVNVYKSKLSSALTNSNEIRK